MISALPPAAPLWTALAVAVLALVGEWLHARRTRCIAALAFPGRGRPRRWAQAAPLLRVGALAALAWGLAALLVDAPGGGPLPRGPHHLVIALDVSPSMDVVDAGPASTQTRGERARDVLRSALARSDLGALKVSVIAYYSAAKPVVIDTEDREVLANLLADLPLSHVFAPGRTSVYSAVASAAAIGKGWPAGSAALLVVGDGDSLPPEGPPRLPPAYRRVVIAGVGDSVRGTFVGDHLSRQDERTLRDLAGRLGGAYHDANRHHLPKATLASLAPPAVERRLDRTAWALLAILVGAAVEALLPLALRHAGAPGGTAGERPIPAGVLHA